jgi:hypothetical protein
LPFVFHAAITWSLKYSFRPADNSIMEKSATASWYVSKKGKAVGVMGPDSSVVAILPEKKNSDDSRIKEAYLIAAAPQLFEVCCRIKSILENSFIVTPEGFKINCADIQQALLDAVLRARGYRKASEEP